MKFLSYLILWSSTATAAATATATAPRLLTISISISIRSVSALVGITTRRLPINLRRRLRTGTTTKSIIPALGHQRIVATTVGCQKKMMMPTTNAGTSSSSSYASRASLPTVAEFLHDIHPRTFSQSSSQSLPQSLPLSLPLSLPPSIQHVSLGNPAGDADSLISAIGSAYLDTYLHDQPTLPLLSISVDDLQTQRLETKYLLQLAGISDVTPWVSVLDTAALPSPAFVTLVDHNQLMVAIATTTTQPTTITPMLDWTVEAIWDHHWDEGAHTDTCAASATSSSSLSKRHIAFQSQSASALVASTCTLMVERWRTESFSSRTLPPLPPSQIVPPSFSQGMPPTLSILLLGVILLDSINLSPHAGKATVRDQQAVQFLLETTDWSVLEEALPTDLLPQDECVAVDGTENGGSGCNGNGNGNSSTIHRMQPDPTKLFETLQQQKFHPDFWNGLTTLQAIQLDYKRFVGVTAGAAVGAGGFDDDNDRTFGLATVLQPMSDFLKKTASTNAPPHSSSISEAILHMATTTTTDGDAPPLDFVGIMFMSMTAEDQAPERQLLLASQDGDLLEKVLEFLTTTNENGKTLQLQVVRPLYQEEANDDKDEDEAASQQRRLISRPWMVQLNQGNAKASRKQVAPILMDYYKQ